MEIKRKKQILQVLDHLEKYGSITQLDAIRFGCLRLSARIWDLRHIYGAVIDTKMKKVINEDGTPSVVAEYRLIS